jgi:hypothetical protein
MDSIYQLAASFEGPLAGVIDRSQRLANLIKPDVIPTGKHTHRIAEARGALAIATADLAATTAKFHRVAELLKGL